MRSPLAAAARRLACGLLLLLAVPAAGLDPQTALTQYGHTAWHVRDGSFAGSPSALAQTADGFLWIGADVGLIRFDGVRFTPWEPPPGERLPDEHIIALLASRDGSLWIGTAKGLARWQGGRLTVYARVGRFGALIEDRHGTIWAGHTRIVSEVPPLCRFERGKFGCFRFPEKDRLRYVGALHEDRLGNVWIGGETGVCRFRPEAFVPEALECQEIPGMATLVGREGVFRIADDGEGVLWAVTMSQGVWRLPATAGTASGRWTVYPEPPEREIESLTLLSDRAGALWIGTQHAGLLRRLAGRTERFTRADGLSGDVVDCLLEDREGSLWVATSSGLDRFRDLKVATLTAREGLPGEGATAVTPSRDGGLWVSAWQELVHLGAPGAAGPVSYETMPGVPGKRVAGLREDSRGRLWLGVDNRLAHLEDSRFSLVGMPDGGPVGVVRAIVEDREGDLWIATTAPGHTVVRIREGAVAEAFAMARFGGQAVQALAADPVRGVWAVLPRRLVKLVGGGSVEPTPSLGEAGSGGIDDLLVDARGVWAATSRGLGLWRNGRWRLLDTRGGLPCDGVDTLVTAADGALWLKGPCGLIRLPASELDAWVADPERRVRARLLDVFDGVQAALSPFSPRAARSRDGRLWFAIEEGGLQVVDPKRLRDNPLPPPVHILRAVADRKVYQPASGLRLPALTRDVEIDYTALSLAVPEKVRFRYRLEGAEKEWQDPGTRREAFYTNLGPGDYRFRVVACNNDGVWNRQGAALAFTILPAFYQTRWFLALAALAAAALVWGAFRWRVRQVRASLDRRFEERLAERTRIAQDLHDTLLQGVLSSSMQLYAAVEELPAGEPARPRFERVQQLMRQVIEEGRAALSGLRSAERSEDDLGAALSRVPGELGIHDLADGKPGAGLRVVVEGHPRPLLPEVRDEIYRIAREALVNAFRHSGAKSIEVEIEYAPRQLRVVIRDDGAGIDPEVLRAGREDHWGLSGMRERAERIGAHLKVWSRDGAGTEIELTVPGKIAFTA